MQRKMHLLSVQQDTTQTGGLQAKGKRLQTLSYIVIKTFPSKVTGNWGLVMRRYPPYKSLNPIG